MRSSSALTINHVRVLSAAFHPLGLDGMGDKGLKAVFGRSVSTF